MLTWTKAKLAELGIRPKKKMGQNFTVNPKIIEFFLSEVPRGEVVAEVGAGLGALTVPLSSRSKRVIAIEKDPKLCNYLKSLNLNNVDVICGDALELELDAPIIVGSLPYSISGPLLAKLFTRGPWKKGVFLLQKEVAERLVAEPGTKEYGRLTVMAALCCDVRLGPTWGPESFYPRPEVLSRHVVLIKKNSVPKEFSDFLACVFSQRNKKARKVLPSCGARWEGEERVRELSPESLWAAWSGR